MAVAAAVTDRPRSQKCQTAEGGQFPRMALCHSSRRPLRQPAIALSLITTMTVMNTSSTAVKRKEVRLLEKVSMAASSLALRIGRDYRPKPSGAVRLGRWQSEVGVQSGHLRRWVTTRRFPGRWFFARWLRGGRVFTRSPRARWFFAGRTISCGWAHLDRTAAYLVASPHMTEIRVTWARLPSGVGVHPTS
jgi:hypothetical protein